MKFFTFEYQGLEEIGILTKDGKKIIPIDEVRLSQEFFDMNDFIETHEKSDIEKLDKLWKGEEKSDVYYDFDKILVLAPIPLPLHDIISIGLNYKAHIPETVVELNIKNEVPASPVIFSKRARHAGGAEAVIPLHEDITKKLDYEVELGVVIGKEISKIAKSEVKESIFGYTIMNDISARDLMVEHQQWTIGKGLDGAVVMGPCIVHKDYIDYPVKLNISAKINGELRQNSNTENFIFDIDTLISDISRGMTLEAGDIISTGTPAGVGMSFDPPKYLKDGDIIECEIEKIGVLKNTVKR
ncbi:MULTISPECIES: fumarylacetoacetate hydrolase family protein [Psychrilyobacter]|uniref:FAA hydrolase family protein n=1 Tax=Psychrilyobacter piezotolerans TaxID=2293438 RepID=A0ABX9KG42_9FUSO|nr:MULTISPECIES: fumarylacetoacetate hydrolase family protein [Psychrilyobacter]MCS5422465.1 fumarylacetoacetate hydrolase family protein [Psychrilyobacter sp. S5]NDI78363.1 fumarylacetoacetate hydrolase family protein [Psychrilyobacter piezotolerans]RDE61092.1 FAA hydrolase family protein [Psychrilyobacter sp. S5]REI40733.1 FAA hydrolase family protein [Psychrilyobacter piezotolerans]